jgi:hypothetical protein
MQGLVEGCARKGLLLLLLLLVQARCRRSVRRRFKGEGEEQRLLISAREEASF